MRARWALLMNKVSVYWREVSLSNKPDELIMVSPKGTVPVLITSNGLVLEQSIDIMLWSLEKSNVCNSSIVDQIQSHREIKYCIESVFII